jgi:hypothetical protein
VAFAAKSAPGFDPERAKMDDQRAFWAYALLDAQGFTAVVAHTIAPPANACREGSGQSSRLARIAS